MSGGNWGRTLERLVGRGRLTGVKVYAMYSKCPVFCIVSQKGGSHGVQAGVVTIRLDPTHLKSIQSFSGIANVFSAMNREGINDTLL